MEDIKISVIVPVYKVEKYIKTCVDSLLNQTYKNIEVILINDGSPDNCSSIIDEYGEKDSRIKAVHKNNGGSSSARNFGINIATGDYIVFIDSDDYWDDDKALEEITKNIHEYPSDVIIWGYKKIYENNNKTTSYDIKIDRKLLLNQSKYDAFDVLIDNGGYVACAWNKMIKKKLFDNNNLYFDEGVTSEDVEWCARLAVYAKSFDVINKSFYVYRQREGSITKTIKPKNVNDLYNNCVKIYSLGETIVDLKFINSFYTYLANQFCNLLIVLNYSDKDMQDQICNELLSYFDVFRYCSTIRNRVIYFNSRIFGLKNTVKILGVVLHYRNKYLI